MVSGKTKSGFEFKVNEKVITSWHFTKIMKNLTSKNESEQLTGAVDFVESLLGDQEEALVNHLADEDGIVSTTEMIDEAVEIINIVQKENPEVKN